MSWNIDSFLYSWYATIFIGLAATIMGAAVVHSAIWSALGIGNVVKRNLTGLALGFLVLFGMTLGIFFASSGSAVEPISHSVVRQTMYLIPSFAVAQIPFWIARLAFGWQLTTPDQLRQPFTIGHLFFVTFLFALSFTAPVILGELDIEFMENLSRDNELLGDDDHVWVDPSDDDAGLNAELRSDAWRSVVTAAVAAGALSLLTMPIIYFVFRFSTLKAIISLVLYGITLSFIVAVVLSLTTNSRFEIDLIFSLQLTATVVIALSIPLVNARNFDTRLSTTKTATQCTTDSHR